MTVSDRTRINNAQLTQLYQRSTTRGFGTDRQTDIQARPFKRMSKTTAESDQMKVRKP